MLTGDRVELAQLKEYATQNACKLKVYETITENWNDVERNYALMQLTDTALTTMAQLHVKDVIEKPIPKLNRFELMRQMSSDNLTNTIYNLPNWMNECFSKLNNFVRD